MGMKTEKERGGEDRKVKKDRLNVKKKFQPFYGRFLGKRRKRIVRGGERGSET